MKIFRKKYAFTIAEVLISLTIIGTLATFSLPSLMLSYKKHTTAVALKDTYRELNSAIGNLSVKEGCAGNLVCKDLLTNFGQKLSSQYHLNKLCNNETGNCWNQRVYTNINNNIQNTGGEPIFINYNAIGESFVDEKERIFNIQITNPNCDGNISEDFSENDRVPQNHKLKNVCGFIVVDLDGNKTINTYGVDVFLFILTNTRNSYLYPFGGKYHNQYWKTHNICQPENNFYNGRSCAGRIMEEKWKINYFDR